MNMRFQYLSLCLAIITGITACHDDNSNSNNPTATSTKTITLTPSLGKITKGRALLKNLAGQPITEIKDIGNNGTVSFTVNGLKFGDALIAEVLPAADGKLEYADEAIPDKLVSLDLNNTNASKAIFRAASTITSDNTNLGVTALTEAALTYAQSMSAQLTQDNIEAANQKITEQLKLSQFKITDAPAVIGLNDFSPLINTALATQQRAYASYLATLAKECKRLNAASTQPAYDMLQALSKDLSDGTFDAKQNANALSTYNSNWVLAWSKWISVFYDSLFKLQNIGDLTAWLNAFNAQSPNIPTPMPTTPTTPTTPATPNTETCASKKLPVNTLSAIIDYAGDYLYQGDLVLDLNTTAATATVKGTKASIKEVCGPNVQNNGTNQYVITDKGYITLFKTTAGKYSAEGIDFKDSSKIFFGEKVATTSATCSSTGADDKLGFGNAPQDFCSFSKASSVAITSPNVYTFFNADKSQNVKITVENNLVKSVQVEDNTYAWACGTGTLATCSGVTFSTANNYAQIGFNNTTLSVVNGTSQALTINSGLLIHMQTTTPTPAPSGSCNGNTNQWGCVSITGQDPSIAFTQNSTTWTMPQVRQFNPSTQILNVQFNHKSTPLDDGMTITKINSNHSYISFVAGGITYYQCGTYGDETSVCPGLALDAVNRTLGFSNVKLVQTSDSSKVLTINGRLKF